MLFRPTGLFMVESVVDNVARALEAAMAAGATAFERAFMAEEYFETARDAIDAFELDRSERFSIGVDAEERDMVSSLFGWTGFAVSGVDCCI